MTRTSSKIRLEFQGAVAAAAVTIGALVLALAHTPGAQAAVGYYSTGNLQCNKSYYELGGPRNIHSIAVYPPNMTPTDEWTTLRAPQVVAWIPELRKWAPDAYGRYDWRVVGTAPVWLWNDTAAGYSPAFFGSWKRLDNNASVGFWTFTNLSPGTYQMRNYGVWYPTSRVSATSAYMGLSLDMDLFNSCAF